MGKFFRGLAIFEFVSVVIITMVRIFAVMPMRGLVPVVMLVISGLIAALFALPLYALGKMVDVMKGQQEKIDFLMLAIKQSTGEIPGADKNKKDPRVLFPDRWKCSCGRVNADYVSTCACGKARCKEVE